MSFVSPGHNYSSNILGLNMAKAKYLGVNMANHSPSLKTNSSYLQKSFLPYAIDNY